MTRPAHALIDLNALRHNYRLAQSIAPNSQTMAIIKANAYGHGMIETAHALQEMVPAFGVATIDEAMQLRKANIEKPILSLQGAFSHDEIKLAEENSLWLTIDNHQQIKSLLAAKINRPVNVWLKIDTGMHRLGIQPEETDNVYRTLSMSRNVQDEIIVSTHFARADELDCEFTEQQIDLFLNTTNKLQTPISMANSPAILGWQNARADWNRAGFMLFGNSPFNMPHTLADQLKPVMTLKSAVISVREVAIGDSVGYGHIWQATRASKIATVTIGYGDGYPRHASSGTPVLVRDKRAPLVGRVSMDMITIDVTDIDNVEIGDEVELWGKNISVNEVAHFAQTSGYEVLTCRTNRVPNSYID